MCFSQHVLTESSQFVIELVFHKLSLWLSYIRYFKKKKKNENYTANFFKQVYMSCLFSLGEVATGRLIEVGRPIGVR